MPESTLFTNVEVVIQDYNEDRPIVFSSLQLHEELLNVNHFSFSLQPAISEDILSSVIDFKRRVLGKDVVIAFKDVDGNNNHTFKGIVCEVNSTMIDEQYHEFQISGKGIFCKVDELKVCKSYYKQTLSDIIDKAFKHSDLKYSIEKDPSTTKELHYIVQYHQTLFEFLCYLAIRFGEWMYYDGEHLKFGKRSEDEIVELTLPGDISNLDLRAQLVRSPKGMVTTDIFRSEVIEVNTRETAPDNPIFQASEEAGSRAIEEEPGSLYVPSGFNQDVVSDKLRLEQQAIIASAVEITGRTRNSKLRVGGTIKIKENSSAEGKDYIIIRITHSSGNPANYSNSFTAVPAEVPVPPYTNPLIITRATPQPAIVTDNEDDAGLARVKVRFPWMGSEEKSPWISMLVPHAGRDRGFRFLPEVDDEVMVSFWDNNVELPFVSGAVYTQRNLPGLAEVGNHVKRIGSRSGRRLDINDDEGVLVIADSFNQSPKNVVSLVLNDNEQKAAIQSTQDSDNYSVIILHNGEDLSLGLRSGGQMVAEFRLFKDGPKIEMKSKGDINIQADGDVNIRAGGKVDVKASGEMNLEAQQELQVSSTLGDCKVQAMNVELKGDISFKAEGQITEVKGVQTSIQGNATTAVKGALVLIN
ncbi:type VI secretion system Vgr family protein [Niabella digestorum]|uniref:Phage baseplate assembly protein V n=1 Tax=Niabella digestorum TaxID=3117701 RepID=A0ABU7RET3_9BACT